MRKSDPSYDSLFAGMFQPAIWLRRVREQVSVSKLGGLPWLPSGDLWPRHGKSGRPLHFLAQIELRALPATPLSGGDPRYGLSRNGALFFFADMDDHVLWSDSDGRPAAENPTRVVYADAGSWPVQAPLDIPNVRHSYYGGGEEGSGFAIFPEAWLKAVPFEAFAGRGSPRWKEIHERLTWDVAQREYELREVESAERGAGHPFPARVANDGRHSGLPMAEIERRSREEMWEPGRFTYFKSPSGGYWSPGFTRHQMLAPAIDVQNMAETARKKGWVPLLQLDSDIRGVHGDFMFCDCGMAQYWITPEDLAARRYDRAWATTEGG